MTAGVVATHKAIAGDGGPVIAQVFQCIALDVAAQQHAYQGTGGGMIGLNLSCQTVGAGGAAIFEDAFRVWQTDAVQVVLVAALAVEAHSRVVMLGRYQQVEATAPQNPLDSVLPRLVGNVERRAKVGHLVGRQAQLSPQQATQMSSPWSGRLVADVPVAGAQLDDLALKSLGLLAQLVALVLEQGMLLCIVMAEGFEVPLRVAYCLLRDVVLFDQHLQGWGDFQAVFDQEYLEALGVLQFAVKGLTQLAFALAQVGQFGFDAGDFLAERFLADGGGVAAQGHLGIHKRLAGVVQAVGQVITLEPEAAEIQPRLVEFEAIAFEFGQMRVSQRTATDETIGKTPPPIGLTLLIQFLDATQIGNALAHVGSQGLKVAHRLKLVAQCFHVHQVFIQ